MNKSKMERIKNPEHSIPTTDDVRPRCQAIDIGRLYPVIKRFYQCTAEATDVIRIWDPDDKQVNQLPVCRYHKEHWLKHYGGEFDKTGELKQREVG